MQFSTSTLLSLALSLITTLAIPTGTNPNPFNYQVVTLTFHGGPASYALTFPADGSTYYTNNALSISTIDSSGIDAYSQCNFYTNQVKTLVGGVNRGGSLAIGPPQPIYGVACQPTPAPPATCLPVYATCEWSSPLGGSILLNCCSGYCAATKCRPTS